MLWCTINVRDNLHNFSCIFGGMCKIGLVKARNEVIYLNIVEFIKCTDIKIGTPLIETEIK